MDAEGFGNCTNTGLVVECPKGISLENIVMNREYLSASLKG
jgi:hypothetical protein